MINLDEFYKCQEFFPNFDKQHIPREINTKTKFSVRIFLQQCFFFLSNLQQWFMSIIYHWYDYLNPYNSSILDVIETIVPLTHKHIV